MVKVCAAACSLGRPVFDIGDRGWRRGMHIRPNTSRPKCGAQPWRFHQPECFEDFGANYHSFIDYRTFERSLIECRSLELAVLQLAMNILSPFPDTTLLPMAAVSSTVHIPLLTWAQVLVAILGVVGFFFCPHWMRCRAHRTLLSLLYCILH
jgi:hypothetical protein